MALSIVQQKKNTGTGTTISVTLDSPITPGNSLIVLIDGFASGATIAGVSGGGSSNWQSIVTRSQINIWHPGIYAGTNAIGGSYPIVVTFNSATSSGGSVWVVELSDVVVANGTNSSAGINGTSINSGNVTPDSGVECIIFNVAAIQGATGTTATAGPSGWTDLTGGGPTTTAPASYKIISSASGSYNATYAVGYNNYSVVIAAFKVAPKFPYVNFYDSRSNTWTDETTDARSNAVNDVKRPFYIGA